MKLKAGIDLLLPSSLEMERYLNNCFEIPKNKTLFAERMNTNVRALGCESEFVLRSGDADFVNAFN
ncbi:MAG: hypothetical protein LBD75_06685 [Candidatus Peribacteria bacterium]|jgi:hypothetical protein|nr:hypothetical protein [Candidatus Peribacteria bacterium]